MDFEIAEIARAIKRKNVKACVYARESLIDS